MGERHVCRTHELLQLGSHAAPLRARTVTTTGRHRQLVIVAQFSDVPFQGDDFMQLWNDIYNAKNYTALGHYGSMHDYFYAQSYGQFDLQFDLFFTTLPNGYAYYGVNDSKGYDRRAGEMVVDAVKGVEDQIADWSVYDWDADGYINQVIIQYSGKGENDRGGANTIWPHQWTLSEEGTGVYTLPNGLKIDCYECSSELDRDNEYGTFGVLCHEFSHCFGLPDYYNGSTQFVGMWDVMDYGLYNGNGFCPAGYTAHERMLMGWLEPTELTEPATVSGMQPVNEQPEAYLVRNDGYSNEFYLLENRQQTGWDSCVPGSGLLVFHIDYNQLAWSMNQPNTSSNKRYTIFAANNNTSDSKSALWPYPYQDNDSLTNNSKPAATLLHKNSDGTNYMNKPLTHMQVTDGLASFDFMGGATAGILSLRASSGLAPSRVYDLHGHSLGTSLVSLPQGIYIIRYANGETKKVVKH